jgi:hypothetical protein
MEHVHDGPKAAEKTEAPRIRRNAAQPTSSPAAGLLDLQRTAGNQAVARMLAGTTNGLDGQPYDLKAPAGEFVPRITVQRQELEAQLKELMRQEGYDPKIFAAKLVEKMKEPAAGSSKSTPQKTTGAGKKTTTAELTVPSIATKEGIAARETQLKDRAAKLRDAERIRKGQLTSREKALQAKSRELDQTERAIAAKEGLARKQQEIKEKQQELNERVTKLQQGKTPEEIANRNKEWELEVLEKEQAAREEREEAAIKSKLRGRMLNPNKKSMSGLLGRRSL